MHTYVDAWNSYKAMHHCRPAREAHSGELGVHQHSRGCVEGKESTKEPEGSDTESPGMCHGVQAREAETTRRQVTSQDTQR